MRYQDFSLQIVPRLIGRYVVYAQSWQGEVKGVFEPPPAWAKAEGAWSRQGRGRGPVRDMRPISSGLGSSEASGEQLFQSLFPPEVLRLYERSLDQATGSDGGLRIKLMLDPSDPELENFLDLPWEELRQPGMPDFLALSSRHSIVRYPMVPRPIPAAKHPPKLRILVVAASPCTGHLPLLDLERERRNLTEALKAASDLEIVDVSFPTLAGLRQTLQKEECHVLHFMGHGGFDADGGVLYFETAEGSEDPVSGEDLANKLTGFPMLRLVVLNACKSARVAESPRKDGHRVLTGVATSLVAGGLPAAVAMRSAISDEAAIAFSRAFYERLAKGGPVDAAMVEGRQAIHSEARERAEWATPVLFMRTKDGELFPAEDLPGEKYPKRPWWPGWVVAAALLLLLGGGLWLLAFERLMRDGSRLLQQTTQQELALRKFSQAAHLAPRSAEAHLGIAMADESLGFSLNAEENYSKAVDLAPRDPRYRYHLGAFLNLNQRYEEASRELARAIAEDRTYVQAYNELARSQIGLGIWRSARATLSQALEYAQDNDPELSVAPLYDKLGQVDLHDERLDDAVKHLTGALERYPHGDFRRLQTLTLLTEAYSRKHDQPKACATVEEFRAIHPHIFTDPGVAILKLARLNHCPWPEEPR